MQTRDKLFDDLSQLMTNAAGMAQGMKTEAETAFRGLVDRWLADADLVTREEFDAQKAVLERALVKLQSLQAQIAELESGRK